jgi:hypothetical protein
VVGTDRLTKLRADNHARTIGCGTTREQHDPRAGIGERTLSNH